jgi:hypothetical protein
MREITKWLNLMTGLNPDFLLLSSREHAYTDYLRWRNKPRAVKVHDDIMRYIRDTLTCITCYNPATKMAKHKGLNFYGPTVIKSEGAIIAGSIFAAWAILLSNEP